MDASAALIYAISFMDTTSAPRPANGCAVVICKHCLQGVGAGNTSTEPRITSIVYSAKLVYALWDAGLYNIYSECIVVCWIIVVGVKGLQGTFHLQLVSGFASYGMCQGKCHRLHCEADLHTTCITTSLARATVH